MSAQSSIFIIAEVSKKWYDSLPADLQQIVDRAGTNVSLAINPEAVEILEGARKGWVNAGGELIDLPPDEQAALIKTLASVGEDVSKTKPKVSEAYQVVVAAAQRGK